jgi:LuxR family transcriptional regulator, maltose regulon positive regulatory protein
MTELLADVSVAVRLHEGGSRRRALRPAIQDRYPPPSVTVLPAVAEDAQHSAQPGGGGPDAALVARNDLMARLDQSAARKVTVVSAPAGSGKTSLLRAWAAGPGRAHRVAFVPVQQGEEDTQGFWLALLSAVRQACGATADEPSAAAPGFNGRAMAGQVLSALAGHCGRVVMVIDDVHELNSPEALGQLACMLADLPSHAHAIVSTRRDLPLKLHQLRLAGELAEIRAADLQFSEREAGELLAASGIALSEGGTALLWQRTEGWAAGLRLAALSLAGHPDPERFAAEFSGSDRTVAEYLLGEMLDRQPAGVQDLLLRTCLLDRVNGELADLLTGRPGAERMLLDLEEANAFVVSLDAERTWFRYHRLFADLLRLQLRRTLPDQVPALHRRAAQWLSEHGQVADAIRHTQAAGDWPGAARLLADHCLSLTLDGQAQTIRALVRAFPPGARTDPELALVRATGEVVRGHLEEAAAYLAVAKSHAETTAPDRQRRLGLATASVQLWLARRRGDLAGVTEQAGFLACPVTGQSDKDIALGNDLRAAALMNLGTVEAWSLRQPDAEHHLEEGAALARQIGRPYLEVGCLAQLGSLAKPGSSATAVRRCREAIALAERHGWGDEPVIAAAMVALAERMIWTGDFGESERWLRRAESALRADGGPDIRFRLHLVTGTLRAARGRHHEALTEFRAAERFGSQLMSSLALASRVTGWLLATQARLGMTGKARDALAALDDERAKSPEIGNARAMISLADGEPAAALAAAQEVLDGTVPAIGDAAIVAAHLLAGLAHRELGDQRAANHAAERALALAEADRLVLPFAMTGSRELLEALPRHETAHAALLADVLDIMRGATVRPADPPVPQQVEQLSHSELKVLRYLPTNLSRPEIAAELCVSVNTVSTHIRSIYAKLGTDDRSAAVRCARKLRLLGAPRR